MKKRALGRSGLEIAPIALGTSVFGWTVDEPTAFDLMDVFVARGFNLLDTANAYYVWAPGNKGGESETIIGNWLARRGRRNDVILATKVGEEMAPSERGLSRKYIMRAVEDSLSRLRTHYIDLYQAHIDDRKTPLEETLDAFEALVEQGKARVIGASNYEAPRLAEAIEISGRTGAARYESLQILYNLCDRAPFETDLMALCQAQDVGVITYRSLARGFLSGKYRWPADRDLSVRGADAITYLDARGLRILAALDEVASSYRANPAQVALAWLIAQPGVTSAITSASRPAQLDELLGAVELTLEPNALALLSAGSA